MLMYIQTIVLCRRHVAAAGPQLGRTLPGLLMTPNLMILLTTPNTLNTHSTRHCTNWCKSLTATNLLVCCCCRHPRGARAAFVFADEVTHHTRTQPIKQHRLSPPAAAAAVVLL
jgi:hypothetical protein